MAKQFSGSIKKKPESPEDQLQIALYEIARHIALIEPERLGVLGGLSIGTVGRRS